MSCRTALLRSQHMRLLQHSRPLWRRHRCLMWLHARSLPRYLALLRSHSVLDSELRMQLSMQCSHTQPLHTQLRCCCRGLQQHSHSMLAMLRWQLLSREHGRHRQP